MYTCIQVAMPRSPCAERGYNRRSQLTLTGLSSPRFYVPILPAGIFEYLTRFSKCAFFNRFLRIDVWMDWTDPTLVRVTGLFVCLRVALYCSPGKTLDSVQYCCSFRCMATPPVLQRYSTLFERCASKSNCSIVCILYQSYY